MSLRRLPTAAVVGGLLLLVFAAREARVDDVRPLTLTIEETAPGRFGVRFQTPMRGNARLRVAPRLPDGSTLVPDSLDRQVVGDSLIERFEFEHEGGLVGETIGVDGLALGSRSALLTLRLDDGRVLRAVLGGARPTYSVEPLPSTERAPWTTDVADAAWDGLVHGLTHPAHVLLALALVFAFVVGSPLGGWVHALGAFLLSNVAGQWLGPLDGLDAHLADALVALVAALAIRECLVGRQRRLLVLAGLAGFAHGLALPAATMPVALASTFGLDLAHVVVGCMTLGALFILRLHALARVVAWTGGVVALAVALTSAIHAEAPAAVAAQASLPVPVALSEAPSASKTPRGLVTEVECYVDVGVFETRLEVLGRWQALERWLGGEPHAGETIEVTRQDALLERASAALLDRVTVTIDGEAMQPTARRAGFATQDPTGTYLRTEPVGEEYETALAGFAYAFRTPTIPRTVSTTWSDLPPGLAEMRARVIDPEISREVVLGPADLALAWENVLTEDPLPPVAAVEVRRQPVPLPVLSVGLVLAALLGGSVILRRRRRALASATLRVGVAVALLAAPFLTVEVSDSFASPAAPTAREARAIAQALLENVYRAFNVRDEDAVYDQLAFSLAEGVREAAYLESRRTLAFERVGGAKTHVDAVELKGLDGLEERGQGGFAATVAWSVAGSVTHFGHRHLRVNLYRARLDVVPDAGAWRIETFDLEDVVRQR